MVMRWSETSEHVRCVVYLLHLTRTAGAYQGLSEVLVREVGEYVRDTWVFPLLSPTRVFDSHSRKTTLCTAGDINESSIFCHIRANYLFVTGDISSTSHCEFLLLTQHPVLTPAPSFLLSRDWPGLCHFQDVLYAFGGSDVSGSGEYLSVSCAAAKWSRLPNMSTERRAFTPAIHSQEIYLCTAGSHRQLMEIFTPSAHTYRQVNIWIGGLRSGSVSFFVNDSLVVFTRDGKLCEVNIKDNTLTEELRTRGNGHLGVSTVQPTTVGQEVLWTSARTGSMVVFSLTTRKISTLNTLL